MIAASYFTINTPLQRGVGVWWTDPNRFSGFRQGGETVEIETVLRLRAAQNTPLKQGVNDKLRNDNHLVCEMFRLCVEARFGVSLGRVVRGEDYLVRFQSLSEAG